MSTYGFETEGNTIVHDFADEVRGKTFLITGPSEGSIGAETAISLSHASPKLLILLGRNIAKIQPTIDSINSASPSTAVKFIPVSLDSLTSVRDAAKKILDDAEITSIEVIINNAGVMACPFGLTKDGFETQFATNHLSHFLLTNLLMPKILLASNPRIINVSSSAHMMAGIDFTLPPTPTRETYDAVVAYARAKTANILFTVSLNKRLNKGASWALHPGSIISGLQKHFPDEVRALAIKEWVAKGNKAPVRKSLQQGCSTTLRAALDPELKFGPVIKDEEGRGGRSCYLDNCQVGTGLDVVKGWALDEKFAEKLWDISEGMVGEKFSWW